MPGVTLISSWNGVPALNAAAARLASGGDLLDAMVEGVSLVEDDPNEMTVGYGGLPNEEGDVELDAAVMDAERHRVGAVAALRGIRHASKVALEVMRRTDHCLLVGEGASRFARRLGFREENLLTDAARTAWLEWKASLSERDAWLSNAERATDFGTARSSGLRQPAHQARPQPPFTYGTIHVSGLDAQGRLGAVTSTSGLSYKIAGRVGDTPIAGAGLYCERAVGSAGATGRGEAVLQTCCAHRVVDLMRSGREPVEAALEALRVIVSCTRESRLLDERGLARFNVTVYALRADGARGAASIHPGFECAVHDAAGTRLEACASLLSGD